MNPERAIYALAMSCLQDMLLYLCTLGPCNLLWQCTEQPINEVGADNFNDRSTAYNSRHPDSPCPRDILLSEDANLLSAWLQSFIFSTQKNVW